MDKQKVRCNRCGGAGIISHLVHIDNGICYACEGRGYLMETPLAERVATKATQERNGKFDVQSYHQVGYFSDDQTVRVYLPHEDVMFVYNRPLTQAQAYKLVDQLKDLSCKDLFLSVEYWTREDYM